jgi:phosphatidylserine synthase
MPRPNPRLVIDARPRGPGGPLAAERLLGRCVLAHLLDAADRLDPHPIVIHARQEEHRRLKELVADWPPDRLVFAPGPPSEGAIILRTDRLYDPRRLHRAVRKGREPETAVIWRLDRPKGLAGAEAELIRRQTYQPLGRFWALGPARLLARALCPTAVRPNALTLAAALLMLTAAAAVAFASTGRLARGLTAAALALALVLDTADGHLARLQGTASEFGRWLDELLDELSDMALHAAIAWSAFARDQAPAWLVLGMVYAMGKYVFLVGNQGWHQRDGEPRPGLPAPARGESRSRALVHWLGHADVRWHLWIVLAALGRLDAALAAYAMYFPARTLAGAIRKRKAAVHG